MQQQRQKASINNKPTNNSSITQDYSPKYRKLVKKNQKLQQQYQFDETNINKIIFPINNAPTQKQINNAPTQKQINNAPTQKQINNAPAQNQILNINIKEQSFPLLNKQINVKNKQTNQLRIKQLKVIIPKKQKFIDLEKKLSQQLRSPIYGLRSRQKTSSQFKPKQTSYSQQQIHQQIKTNFKQLNQIVQRTQTIFNQRLKTHQNQLLKVMQTQITKIYQECKKIINLYNDLINDKKGQVQLDHVNNQISYYKNQAINLNQQNHQLKKQVQYFKKLNQQFQFKIKCDSQTLFKLKKKLMIYKQKYQLKTQQFPITSILLNKSKHQNKMIFDYYNDIAQVNVKNLKNLKNIKQQLKKNLAEKNKKQTKQTKQIRQISLKTQTNTRNLTKILQTQGQRIEDEKHLNNNNKKPNNNKLYDTIITKSNTMNHSTQLSKNKITNLLSNELTKLTKSHQYNSFNNNKSNKLFNSNNNNSNNNKSFGIESNNYQDKRLYKLSKYEQNEEEAILIMKRRVRMSSFDQLKNIHIK